MQKCPICKKYYKNINNHLFKKHKILNELTNINDFDINTFNKVDNILNNLEKYEIKIAKLWIKKDKPLLKITTPKIYSDEIIEDTTQKIKENDYKF